MTLRRSPIYAAILAAPLALLGGHAIADLATDQAINAERIKALEAQLEMLKADVATTNQVATSNTQKIETVRPEKAGTEFQYGGFIQLDAIYSDYEEGKYSNNLIEDFLVPSLIPVENADPNVSSDSFTSTNFHAKTSRFFFTTNTNTDAGAISTRFELDFILSGQGDERISNSQAPRLRHAFVKWQYNENSSLLVGQTWSTFFNVGALPDLLDFVGPVGTLFNRQAMIRWTTGGFDFALENPYTRLKTVDGTDIQSDSEVMPDLVLRYNGTMGSLGWSLAAIGRELSYDERGNGGNTQVSDDTEYGYGLSLAGKWMIGRDDFRFMVNYGNALGRYMGLNAFNDGYIDNDGKIQTFDQYGGFIAYRHFWSDHWRSNFSLSIAEADNPDSSDVPGVGGYAKTYQSAHVNLNYVPTPALQLGGEFIYATKELEDGRDGALSRFQFSVKYGF
jgi:hypothetical protein